MKTFISTITLCITLISTTAHSQETLMQHPTQVQLQAIEKAKSEVSYKMIDPESAKFRSIVTYKDQAVCGEVSAKNLYGGYVPYKPFLHDIKSNLTFIIDASQAKSLRDIELLEKLHAAFTVCLLEGAAEQMKEMNK